MCIRDRTMGRAARNINGRVIMYADTITDSMRAAIEETERRRSIQKKFNETHGIVPSSVKKSVRDVIDSTMSKPDSRKKPSQKNKLASLLSEEEQGLPLDVLIDVLTKKMAVAAAELRYEEAAVIRDTLKQVKSFI